MGRIHHQGRCLSCVARQHLVELFTRTDGQPARHLTPLAEQLARIDSPYTLWSCVRRSALAALISRMVSGDLECSHQALDGLPQTVAVSYLRDLLVLVELLPARDEELARFHQAISQAVADVADSRDQIALPRHARS